MAINELLAMVATVTTPGTSTTVNSMGDPIPGPPTTSSAPCWCEQLTALELTAGRDVNVLHWRMFMPPDAVIGASSTVVVDQYPGLTFSVDGVPWRAIIPIDNVASHIEVLMVVSG